MSVEDVDCFICIGYRLRLHYRSLYSSIDRALRLYHTVEGLTSGCEECFHDRLRLTWAFFDSRNGMLFTCVER